MAGRRAKVVDDWLATRDDEWLVDIDTVAIDPFSGYATGVALHLGHARLVVDPFHAVALANRAIDDVRRLVKNDTVGHFDEFVAECKTSTVPELHRLARTALRWKVPILAYHLTGASDGPTEAVNLVVEKAQRVAHGFRSFGNYRLRIRLHCGVEWQTPPTARIRGCRPRWSRKALFSSGGSVAGPGVAAVRFAAPRLERRAKHRRHSVKPGANMMS